MADNTLNTASSSLTSDDVSSLEELLHDLKERAQASHDANSLVMHQIYVKLVAIVSPIVISAHARMEREHLASQRKQLQALKQSRRSSNA